jgi:hypothetical protein
MDPKEAVEVMLRFLEKYKKNIFQRLIPEQLDIVLLSSWLLSCQVSHRHSKSQGILDFRKLGGATFRVVDVVSNKLVPIRSAPCRYVTLSYVWGNVLQQDMALEDFAPLNMEALPKRSKMRFILQSVSENDISG